MRAEDMRKLVCPLGVITGKRINCVADECVLCTKGHECVLARYLSGKMSYIQAKEKIEIAGEEHYSFERAKTQVEEIVEKLDITGEGAERGKVVGMGKKRGINAETTERAIDALLLEGGLYETAPKRLKKRIEMI